VTRRKKLEQELDEQKKQLSDFLQNATEGIEQIAGDGTILWANRAGLGLLGHTEREYIGHHIGEFHVDQDAANYILNCFNHGEVLRDYEARLKHRDGSIRHVLINSHGCGDSDRSASARCFIRDITEHRQAAELVEKAVAKRTAELNEKVAELEIFSYSISHDMRAPLRAMQGYADSLIRDHSARLPPQARHSLLRIERAANRLDRFITDVLTYSRLAKDEIKLTPVALEPLVDELIQQHPPFQKFSRSIFIDRPLHDVLGHAACLTQCLSNLISNGLKFTRHGTRPKVRISTEISDRQVRVWVKDNGIGIAPEHYGRIFQIFGRVYSEKTYPGTGIGLVVVKKAIARMGGETGFQSTPGQGSSFWFALANPNQGNV